MALPPSNSLTPQDKRAERDAAEQDVLMREVDEAVRKGDFEDFSQRYGKLLLGGLVLLLAIFGGVLFWQSRQNAALEKESEALVAGLDQIQAGNIPAAQTALAEVPGDGTAAANAQMILAAIAAQQGRTAQAAQMFDAIAANEEAPPALRDLATIRSVATRYDTMDRAAVVAALKPLAVPGKAYFGGAGELLAHAYLDQGKRAEAGALFAQIAKDEDTPESLRSRARQMAGTLGVDAIEDVDQLLQQQGVGAAQNDQGAAAPVQQ